MNKEEILGYLKERRVILAPVYEIEKRYFAKKHKRDKRLDMIKTFAFFIITPGLFLIFLNIIGLLLISTSYELIFMGLGFLATGIGFLYLFDFLFCKKLGEEMASIQGEFNEITNQQAYREAAQGFPRNFYNYSDVYKLWRLIDESRALTLQEAYNTLERQKVYEDQAAHNVMMEDYQRDIARNTRVSAVGNVVTAVNSQRIYNSIK